MTLATVLSALAVAALVRTPVRGGQAAVGNDEHATDLSAT